MIEGSWMEKSRIRVRPGLKQDWGSGIGVSDLFGLMMVAMISPTLTTAMNK